MIKYYLVHGPTGEEYGPIEYDDVGKELHEDIDEQYEIMMNEYKHDCAFGYEEDWEGPPDKDEIESNMYVVGRNTDGKLVYDSRDDDEFWN